MNYFCILLKTVIFTIALAAPVYATTLQPHPTKLQSERREILFYIGAPHGEHDELMMQFLVAKKLQKLIPHDRLHLIIDENSHDLRSSLIEQGITTSDLLRQLVPEYDDELAYQQLRGLDFMASSHSHFLKADYMIALGFKPTHVIPPLLHSVARRVIIFGSYEKTNRLKYLKQTSPQQNAEGILESIQIFLPTGPGNDNTGLWISPQRPTPDLTREETAKKLATYTARNKWEKQLYGYGLVKSPFADKIIGFSSTKSPTDTINYIRGITALAQSPPYNTKKIVLIVPYFQDLKLDPFPPNLSVISYIKLPVDLMEALIAHSDLPVMVSDDVTMTLAIDYEKPFFYETHSPRKLREVKQFIAHLLRNAIQWNDDSDLLSRWLALIEDSQKPPFPDPMLLSRTVAEVAHNKPLQEGFAKAIRSMRKSLALTEVLRLYLGIFDAFTLEELLEPKRMSQIINGAHGILPEDLTLQKRVYQAMCKILLL